MFRNLLFAMLFVAAVSLTGCQNLFPVVDEGPRGPSTANDFLKQPSTFRANKYADDWGTGLHDQSRDVEKNLGYSHR